MPYTTYTTSTPVSSSGWNVNVRDQVVTPFTSAANRDSNITAPVEGMVCYTSDADIVWVYNGSAWKEVAYVGAPATWTVTVTQSASVAGTTGQGTYVRQGRLITATLLWTASAAGAAATLYVSYPGSITPTSTGNVVIGSGYLYPAAANITFVAIATASGIALVRNDTGANYATALVSGHGISMNVSYFAAS